MDSAMHWQFWVQPLRGGPGKPVLPVHPSLRSLVNCIFIHSFQVASFSLGDFTGILTIICLAQAGRPLRLAAWPGAARPGLGLGARGADGFLGRQTQK